MDHYDNKDHQWKYILDDQVQPVPVKGNIRSNSSMDLKNMACTGLGIVYLPSFTVKREIEDGLLKEILNSYQVAPLNMYAVYPSNRFLSKKTQIFLDFMASLNMVD